MPSAYGDGKSRREAEKRARDNLRMMADAQNSDIGTIRMSHTQKASDDWEAKASARFRPRRNKKA